MDMNITV